MFSWIKTKRKKILAGFLSVCLLNSSFAPSAEALFRVFDIFKPASGVPDVQRTRLVSLLVEQSLLENGRDDTLREKILGYAVDVQTSLDAKAVVIPVPRDASPRDIFEGNAHLFFSGYDSDGRSQLIGTVLVGDVPLPVIEKNGNLWPTIFPYTDFENPVYEWDPEKSRFLFQGGDHEPEIWHGVIRPTVQFEDGWDAARLDTEKRQELIEYFERNHAVHAGTTTFAEKIFFADLPRQERGLDTVPRQHYDEFISHIEDIAYLRFTKHLAKALIDASSVDDDVPSDFFPDETLKDENGNPLELANNSSQVSKIPDVHTKTIIENLTKRYFETWREYLSITNSRVGKAGRWDPEDVENTITLVSKKDEAAALLLRNFNTSLETQLNSELTTDNIAENISIPKNGDHPTVTLPYSQVGATRYKNGVTINSSFAVANCTLLRGSPRDTSFPYTQMVEGNRSYDLALLTNPPVACAAGYAGCCPNNIQVAETTMTFSVPACTVANATLPIFDIAGTKEATSGNRGAQGCSDIVITSDGNGNPDDNFNEASEVAQRFDSLMLHQEPTTTTIAAQTSNLGSLAMPVDDPRGFSFYDHAKTFRRLNYFNAFDLRNLYADINLWEVSAEDMREATGGAWGALSQTQAQNLPPDTLRTLTDQVRKDLLVAEIQSRLQGKITEVNAITSSGNTSSNARLLADRGLAFPGTKATPPAGSGQTCTYSRTEEESKDGAFTFFAQVWTESCPWRQGDVVISTGYGLNDDFNHQWPGAAPTNPVGFVGSVNCTNYTRNETQINANNMRVDRTRTCTWSGTLSGSPYNHTEEQSMIRYYYSSIGDFDDPGSGYTGQFRWPGTACVKPENSECEEDPTNNDLCRNYNVTETYPVTLNTRLQWDETCTWKNLGNPLVPIVQQEKMVRYYETASPLSSNSFASVTPSGVVEDVAEALIWLDKSLEEKNYLVFQNAFAPLTEAQEFFWDQDFHDGYEFAEIVAHPSQSAGEPGMAMVFEGGEGPDTDQFRDAQQDSETFDFQKEEKQTQESVFDEVKPEPKCQTDILHWFPCFTQWMSDLPGYLNQKLFVVDMPDPLLPISFSDKERNQKKNSPAGATAALAVQPSEIRISSGETNPIRVDVSLINANGQVNKFDFESEVSLVFDSNNADRFFTISPSSSATASAGQASFLLLPKTSDVGGKFSLSARIGDKTSPPVPVTVSRFFLEILPAASQTSVADEKGVLLRVRVQDEQGKISKEHEGTILEFKSSWGEFSKNARAVVQDGIAEIQFLAGQRAGEATISISDTAKKLPSAEIEMNILAGEPAKIELFTDLKFLVQDAGFVPVEARLTDEFGNEVKKNHTLTWYMENLEYKGQGTRDEGQGENSNSQFSISNSKNQEETPPSVPPGRGEERMTVEAQGSNTIFVQSKEPLSGAKIGVASSVLHQKQNQESRSKNQGPPSTLAPFRGEEGATAHYNVTHYNIQNLDPSVSPPSIFLEEKPVLDASFDFEVLSSAILEIDPPMQKIVAGQSEMIRVPVRAKTKTKEGIQIPRQFEVRVEIKPADIGVMPQIFSLEDGLGTLEFSAGIRSGTAEVILTSPGFGQTSFSLEITPADPAKILVSADRSSMDANDPDAEIRLDIRVVDAFGNTATNFFDRVYLNPNEPEIFHTRDFDLLVDLEVVSKVDSEKYALDEEAEEARGEGTSPDDQLIETKDGMSLKLFAGQEEIKISPQSGTGKVLMTVKSPNLVPATTEFEITDALTVDEIEDLTPKSMFTLLLGFEGGDLLQSRNVANTWLHSGDTQAVGTLLVEPEPRKRIGFLSPDGILSPEINAEFEFGEFFTTTVAADQRSIGSMVTRFADKDESLPIPKDRVVDLFVFRNVGQTPGVYFLPDQVSEKELRREDRQILFQDEPVFSVSKKGGIALLRGGVEFRLSKNHSLFDWEVWIGETMIGRVVLVPETTEMEEITSTQLLKKTTAGIFLLREAGDVRFEKSFTGFSTNDPVGMAFVLADEKEEDTKMLGSPKQSAEDIRGNDESEIVWDAHWKPGTFFAAGNTIGDSTKWGASDAFILLGDPSLSVDSANTRSTLGITPDIGKQLWRSAEGPIDQVLVADLNGDEKNDVVARVGDRLFALYQDDRRLDNFRDAGPLLRFGESVKKLFVFDNDQDKFSDFFQVSEKGDLILHKNENGTFHREKVSLPEFTGQIVHLEMGNIDDDTILGDLVFSDTERNLHVAYGTEDPAVFEPLLTIENFAPHLETIDEKYQVTLQQDRTENEYLDTEEFPTLSSFFVSYDDIANEVDDTIPDEAIQRLWISTKVSSSGEDSESGEGSSGDENPPAPPSGGGGEEDDDAGIDGFGFSKGKMFFIRFLFGGVTVSLDAIKAMVEEMKKADEDSDDPVADQLKGVRSILDKVQKLNKEQEEKILLSVPYNSRLDVRFRMVQDGEDKLQLGDEVTAKLSVTPDTDLEKFEFFAPSFDGLSFVPDSLRFECPTEKDCPPPPAVLKKKENDQDFWIQPLALKKQETITFVWKLRVNTVPPLTFSLFDFEGNDDIDDILIPWQESDGTKQLIQYISEPRNKKIASSNLLQNLKAALLEGEHGEKEFFHSQKINAASTDEAIPPEEDDINISDVKTYMNTKYDTLGILDLSTLQCGNDCGIPGVPSIVVPPLTPGKQTIYVPPYSLTIPAWPAPIPIFSFLTTLPTPVGPIPFIWPPSPIGTPFVSGGAYPNIFRLYITPTTTLNIAMSICLGPYSFGMALPRFIPGNCFVAIISPLDMLGVCSDDASYGASNPTASISNMVADWNAADAKFQFKKLISNKRINPVDIITTWFGRQIEEFQNIKAPTITLVLPKIPGLVGDKTSEKNLKVLKVGAQSKGNSFGNQTVQAGDDFWERLDKKWYANVKRKEFVFPYPVVPEEQWKKWYKKYAYLKENWWQDIWKDIRKSAKDHWKELKDQVTQKERRQNFAEEYDQSCEGKEDSRECFELWKSTEFFGEFLTSVEANYNNIDTSIKALDEYRTTLSSLEKLKKKIKVGVEDPFEKYTKILEDYFGGWWKANENAAKQWGTFVESIKAFFKSINGVAKLFTDFTVDCPTCNVNRGSTVEGLLRLVLGGVKLPVIPAPKMPNVILDFSRIALSINLEIPKIEAEPVEIALPDLPDFPNIFANLRYDLPKLPPIPILPALPRFPTFSFDIPLPALQIAELPVLISPPTLPKLFAKVEAVLKIPKKLVKLFCLLIGGLHIAPESNLASFIQQWTNRKLLFKLDFIQPALSPVLPSILDIGDVEVQIGAKIELPTLALETVNKLLEKAQEMTECVVNSLSQMSRGNFEMEDCKPSFSLAGDSVAWEENGQILANEEPLHYNVLAKNESVTALPETETVVFDFSKEFENAKLSASEESLIASQAEKSFSALFAPTELSPDEEDFVSEQKQNFVQKMMAAIARQNIFSSINPQRTRNWLASRTIDVDSIPTDAPDDFDSDELVDDQANYPNSVPGLRYFDSATQSAELVTEFPMHSDLPMSMTLGDLGDDEPDELLFSLGSELFLKYLTVPTLSAQKQKDRADDYEDRFDEEYDDRFGHLLWLDWETFRSFFAPVKRIDSATEIAESSVEFERLFPDISYFEWTISDRPDHVFETMAKASDRKSQKWERHGFLLRPKPKLYEIRPQSSRVKKIKGSPIIYASPSEEVALLSPADCTDKNVSKPFFATESVLVGMDDTNRMEIRVPPRPGQEEEFREITIRKGEETMVEYAEVCLTRGAVERVAADEVQKIEARKNLYLPPDTRIELGPNEQMELEFFDGTIVRLQENEIYTLQYFESTDSLVEGARPLPMGNFYGTFQGFRPDGQSFFLSKFLHDPQGADDTNPPQIRVVGGTNVRATVFQKILIDATPTADEQNIERVWWDLYPKKDSNGDGDLTNDADFSSEASERFVRDLLQILLPPYTEPGRFSIFLNVEDASRNRASQEIKIEVTVPKISLSEASLRSRRIAGRLENGETEIPISFERNRRGTWELLRDEPILSTNEGNFQITNLSTGGGVEILDFKGERVAEVLSTGRPVILKENFDFTIEPATSEHAFRIVIREEQKEPIAFFSFTAPDMELVLETKELTFTPGIHVLDREPKDIFVFQKFSGGIALINSQNAQLLGVLDGRGDFYVSSPDISFALRRAVQEAEPLVFEILSEENVIGEFTVQLPRASLLQMEKE